MSGMKVHSPNALLAGGFSGFIDFREGGAEGCRMLREASGSAVILGRPVSEAFDGNEADDLLRTADGIGLSGMRDIGSPLCGEPRRSGPRSGEDVRTCTSSENRRDDIDSILALEPDFLVHMCASGRGGSEERCADSDVPIVVCARSNMYFGLVPPIKEMLDAGVRVAVGTDNAMLCDADSGCGARCFHECAVSLREETVWMRSDAWPRAGRRY
ncbi:MAG: hypothetical protein ACOX10_01025 [Candidatus Methanomethylophilaceae archaeon]